MLEVIQKSSHYFSAITEKGTEIYFNPYLDQDLGREIIQGEEGQEFRQYFRIGFYPNLDLIQSKRKSLLRQLGLNAEMLELPRPILAFQPDFALVWPGLRFSELSDIANLLVVHLKL